LRNEVYLSRDLHDAESMRMQPQAVSTL